MSKIELKAGDIYLDKLFGSNIEITKIEGGFVYYTVTSKNYKSEEVNLIDEVLEELQDGYTKVEQLKIDNMAMVDCNSDCEV